MGEEFNAGHDLREGEERRALPSVHEVHEHQVVVLDGRSIGLGRVDDGRLTEGTSLKQSLLIVLIFVSSFGVGAGEFELLVNRVGEAQLLGLENSGL